MAPIAIQTEKCIGCGQCVRDCVAGFLELRDGKVATKESGCIECGHCYAICPEEAVAMPQFELDNGEFVDMSEFDSYRLLQAMKSRRSIRQFKSQPVEQAKIDMILEAGRYCPTATNSQDIAYTILGGQQDALEAEAVRLFRKGVDVAGKAVAMVRNIQVDDHYFFKGAPLVIIVSAKNKGNANLASSYMELMAESLGLGVLYSGFFVAATVLSGKIKKTLDLPRGHKVVNCMIFGYPAVRYRRIPGRKEAEVRTL